jgi:hypothetical protein
MNCLTPSSARWRRTNDHERVTVDGDLAMRDDDLQAFEAQGFCIINAVDHFGTLVFCMTQNWSRSVWSRAVNRGGAIAARESDSPPRVLDATIAS